MHIYLESLGCRLNAAEMETLARQFAGAGYQVLEQPEQADIIILNTCAVTAQASRKSRHRLRTLQRRNPTARLAVIGCWATDDPETAADQPEVAWVIPNAEKAEAFARITGTAPRHPAPWIPDRWGHTRAFLGIQDGCDYTCTYCVTRILRGPAHSQPPETVVAQVRELVAGGAREVVLTGVCLGSYGRDLQLPHGLGTVVHAILTETDLPRLRLSSVEPWDVDEMLLQQWENPRLCRQLHLPLQAGHDGTLRRMGRRITTTAFAEKVAFVRTLSPDIALTTDLIAGFPGETEADFAAGADFVAELGFARLHVFPYSERTGTPALRLPESVPATVRADRAARLQALGEKLATAYRARFEGQVLAVLWENQDRAGRWHGLTDNYLEVVTDSAESLHNQIRATRLAPRENDPLYGQVLHP